MTGRGIRRASAFREAAEADLIDQMIEIAPELEADVPPELPPDADESDAIDQARPVPLPDDGYDDYTESETGDDPPIKSGA
jgi:hypothetical protein